MAQTIGKCIAIARESCGLSQSELAGLCGLSKDTIVGYENGTKTVKSPFLKWAASERTSANKKAQAFALAFSDALTGKTP